MVGMKKYCLKCKRKIKIRRFCTSCQKINETLSRKEIRKRISKLISETEKEHNIVINKAGVNAYIKNNTRSITCHVIKMLIEEYLYKSIYNEKIKFENTNKNKTGYIADTNKDDHIKHKRISTKKINKRKRDDISVNNEVTTIKNKHIPNKKTNKRKKDDISNKNENITVKNKRIPNKRKRNKISDKDNIIKSKRTSKNLANKRKPNDISDKNKHILKKTPNKRKRDEIPDNNKDNTIKNKHVPKNSPNKRKRDEVSDNNKVNAIKNKHIPKKKTNKRKRDEISDNNNDKETIKRRKLNKKLKTFNSKSKPIKSKVLPKISILPTGSTTSEDINGKIKNSALNNKSELNIKKLRNPKKSLTKKLPPVITSEKSNPNITKNSTNDASHKEPHPALVNPLNKLIETPRTYYETDILPTSQSIYPTY